MSNRRTLLRNTAATAFGATALGALVSTPAEAQTRQQPRSSDVQQRAEIVAVLRSYERALNASDVAGVVRLYTADAVLMAPNAPAAIGTAAVSAAYTGIFQAIDIDLTFQVAEVHVVSPEWAFLRSNSNGSVIVLSNGVQVPSSNQELFVLQKCERGWKLARYSFSSTLPSA